MVPKMITFTRRHPFALGCVYAASAFFVVALSVADATPTEKVTVCALDHGGFVFGPQMQYAVRGHVSVRMSTDEAADLADRIAPHATGNRLPTRVITCLVGQGVATSAANASTHSHARSGSVRVIVDGPSGPKYLGTFSCTRTKTSAGTLEVCARPRKRNGGAIRVRFTVTSVPGVAH